MHRYTVIPVNLRRLLDYALGVGGVGGEPGVKEGDLGRAFVAAQDSHHVKGFSAIADGFRYLNIGKAGITAGADGNG